MVVNASGRESAYVAQVSLDQIVNYGYRHLVGKTGRRVRSEKPRPFFSKREGNENVLDFFIN